MGGHSGQVGGADEAGQSSDMAGSGGDGDDGAAGDGAAPATPLAIYPQEFPVDVSCGQAPSQATLEIQNNGAAPLTLSNVSADSDYVVDVDLPLTITPSGLGTLSVTAPKPKVNAKLGGVSSGTLSFDTNEPGNPTHHIKLTTTLFGGSMEFLDGDGEPLSPAALTLTAPSSVDCPNSATYRLHNTGNLAFRLSGPTFPNHIGGTTTPDGGVLLAPDGYAEFRVGGVSLPGDACSGAGVVAFTVDDAYCGSAPSLSVTWPAGSLSSCACVAPH